MDDETDEHAMSREDIAKLVAGLMTDGATALEIVDTVINCLTPEDGEECPVCGIQP